MNNDHFEQLELKTTIKEEKEGYYQFEETIFYGDKGGMLADVGTINGMKVTDLKYDENEVLWHKVDGILTDPIEMKLYFMPWMGIIVVKKINILLRLVFKR